MQHPDLKSIAVNIEYQLHFKPSSIIVFSCVVFLLLLADLKSTIPSLCPPVNLRLSPESGKCIYELNQNKTEQTSKNPFILYFLHFAER